MSSEPCDAFAPDLSALLDGELPFPDCLPALDHLVACEACRGFYAAARRLSERAMAGPPAAVPEALWSGIAAAAGGRAPLAVGPRPSLSRRPLYATALTAAAVLVLALVLPHLRALRPAAADSPSGTAALREIVVEGARGRMTDERFVALLSEILSADRRYHRETERVLRVVLDRESPPESTETEAQPSGPDRESEPRGEAPRPSRSSALQS